MNGGTLAAGPLFFIGGAGNGQLVIRNGGTVTVPLLPAPDRSVTNVQAAAGTASSIQVSGGSFDTGDLFQLGQRTGPGPTGTSTLEISGTGSMTSRKVEIQTGQAHVSGGIWTILGTTDLSGGWGARLDVSGTGSVVGATMNLYGEAEVRESGSLSASILNINGPTVINGGSLSASSRLVISSEAFDGGVLAINGGQVTAAQVVIGGGEGSDGTLHLNGGVFTTGNLAAAPLRSLIDRGETAAVRFNGGTLQLTGGLTELFLNLRPGEMTLEAGGGTIDTQGFALSTGYRFSGSGQLTKDGTGTLTLSGANTYTGGTAIDSGTLHVTGSISHPSQNFDVNGTLKISGNGSVSNNFGVVGLTSVSRVEVSRGTWNNGSSIFIGINSDGTLEMTGGNVTTPSNVVLGSWTTSVSKGTLDLKGGTLTAMQVMEGVGGGIVTFDGGTLRLAGNQASLFSGFHPGDVTLAAGGGTINTQGFDVASGYGLSGVGSLTKTGSGTLTLSGTNTHTGGTTVTSGTLSVGADANLGGVGGALTLNGATLRNTANFTTHRATTLGVSGGTFETTVNLTHGGVITGSGALHKTGASRLTLTGDNTYTGGTTISSGSGWFQIGAGGTTGSILGDVVNDGFLFINRSDTYTFDGAVSGSGSLIQTSTGRTIFTNDHTHTGGTFVYNGGTLQLGNGGTTGSLVGDVTLGAAFLFGVNEPTTLEVNRSDALTLDGVISGVGSLTQAGPGTLGLGGINTYSGSTSIRSGTLRLSETGSIGNSSGIDIASGATFDVSALAGFTLGASQTLSGNGAILGNVTTAGVIAPGNSTGELQFIGDLLLDSTAIIEMEIASLSDFDRMVVDSMLSYGGTLTLGFLDGYQPADGDTFNLFQGFTSHSGTFDDITIPISGYTANVNYGTGQLTFTAIPEPNTFVFLAISGLATAFLGRNRRFSS